MNTDDIMDYVQIFENILTIHIFKKNRTKIKRKTARDFKEYKNDQIRIHH